MKRMLVNAALCSVVMMSCAKSNDLITPKKNLETEKTMAALATINKSINMPLNGTSVYIKDASTLKYLPGDTLVIPKSVMHVTLYNVRGTLDKPVVITAAPNVVIGGSDRSSVDLNGSYIKVMNLNIKGKPTALGLKAYYCTNIALENITIDSAAIGIMVKNDAITGDSASCYPGAVIRNVSIKNCSVKNCSNEGYYIGNTAQIQNGCRNSPIVGLTVQNCNAENTGWDGFQITNAQNCLVDGVNVINAGTANKSAQISGITIQDATTGSFSNLSVNKSAGSGLNIFGCGDFVIQNVTLKDVALMTQSYGIFVDNRSDWGFNLGAKKLIMSNVSLTQTTLKGRIPMYVVNGTANGALAAIPGTVTNFTYNPASWSKRTVDYANNKYIGGTDGL